MKASIIITTYKRSDFLIRAIESVYNQECENFEIIVVDDNGVGTEFQLQNEILLKEYFPQSHFHYIKLQTNQGACFARNTGAKIAQGDYLFFLDDDDYFLSEKIKIQIALLDAAATADGCLTAIMRLDANGKEVESLANYPRVGTSAAFVVEGNFFTPMLCLRKKSFEKVGGFTEIARFQDRFFMLHCLQLGMQFLEITTPLYVLQEHFMPRITNQGVAKTLESLDIIEKYVLTNVILSEIEKKQFLLQNIEEKAKEYYVSKSYYRLISIRYWLQLFVSTGKLEFLKMVFKSLVPFR
jgi:glycosyltransferase involved in cell wall biosynthesis